jgi:hypothetical protein
VFLLLGLAASILGCGGGKVSPPIDASSVLDPGAVVAPEADSPVAAVHYLVWALNRRDASRYTEILTEDFRFAFAATDSAGNTFRDRMFTRAEESIVARKMFETGTPLSPPLSRLVVTLDRSLAATADPRPGKDARVHQVVRANLVITADTGLSSFRIYGAGLFYLVRGDSAQVPPELSARGFRADKSRWWVERWEDETMSGDAAARSSALPARSVTWGAVKVLYY